MWVLEDYEKKDNIILSVSENDEVSIKEVAEEIAKSMNYSEKINYDTSYANGQYKKTADNSKLINELENTGLEFNFTPLSKGIEESVNWFVNNYDKCKK